MYRSFLAGIGGAVGLIVFYVSVVGLLSGSLQHPWEELLALKYWVGVLVLGFGIQVGLIYHTRKIMKITGRGGLSAAAGTGTSTVAMVACCAHHVTDVLPIIGFSGAALFLSEHKVAFIAFGIVSNIFGIGILVRAARRTLASARTATV